MSSGKWRPSCLGLNALKRGQLELSWSTDTCTHAQTSLVIMSIRRRNIVYSSANLTPYSTSYGMIMDRHLWKFGWLLFTNRKCFVICRLQGGCHSAVVSSKPSHVKSVHEILWTRSPFYIGYSRVPHIWEAVTTLKSFHMHFLSGWKSMYFDLNFNQNSFMRI